MPTTTSAAHLDPVVQAAALRIRREGLPHRWTPYLTVARLLNIAPEGTDAQRANAAMYACMSESRRQVGDTTLTDMPRRGSAARRRTTGAEQAGLLNRRFGVEVEYSSHRINRGTLVRNLIDAGIAAYDAGYTHAVVARWKSVGDGSTGGEVVSPVLSGETGFAQVRTVMQVLREMRAGTGRSASVHVHHDVNDLDADGLTRLTETLEACQQALMAYCDDSRLGSHWAPPVSTGEFRSLRTRIASGHISPRGGSHADREFGSGVSRYRAFNFNAVLTYGTVEFRLHGATNNPAKIKPWIAVGQAIVEFARLGHAMPGTPVTVTAMLNALVAARVLDPRLAAQFAAGVARREANPTPHRRHFVPAAIAA